MKSDDESAAKEYSNGEIVVMWKAEKCKHSGVCARGLPGVFKPKEKPWIKVHSGTSEEITAQVDRCPSGALSWKYATSSGQSGANDQA